MGQRPHLILCDVNAELCARWREAFAGVDSSLSRHVTIRHGDIFNMKADAVVSPANSFGFMDGGIDAAYTKVFGSYLQNDLQAVIQRLPHRELLVGEATTIYMRPPSPFRAMISAPTMRTPRVIVDYDAVRLATRAALREAKGRHFENMVMPGMGAFSGKVPADECARQMRKAYDDVFELRPFPATWMEAAAR